MIYLGFTYTDTCVSFQMNAGKFKRSDLLNPFMFFKCLVFYLELGMEADERHGGDFGLPYGLHLG